MTRSRFFSNSSTAQPDYPPARLNLGTALMQQGNLAGAVKVYRALVELDPTNAEAFYNLGLALKQQDEFAAAEIELRRAASTRSGIARSPVHAGRRPVADRPS